jgi:class 3 adenylate cyclase
MTEIVERTVLFADLRGSTAMYESLGNTDATAVVTQSISLLAQIVALHDGRVIKTLGDGLMAMFPLAASAVAAANDMHDSLERIGPPGNPTNPRARLVPLRLQVGVARGEIIEMQGDVFGDAVNVAARLIDHAGDNETLVTANVLDALDDTEQARFRSLDRMQLRGRVEPVHVYVLESAQRRFGDTQATAFGDIAPVAPEPEGIRLIWMDLNRIYAGVSLPVILGRSPQATYIIDDTRVSRSHARIVWHGGTFQLTDLSYNGTYVRFDHDPEVISLRRGSCTLHGSGVIGLGGSPTDATSASVRFEIMKFADTQPQHSPEFDFPR